MKQLVLSAIVAGTLLLGGCGGGHSFVSAPAPQAPTQQNSGNLVAVTFSVTIPKSVPASAGRNLQYVSMNTSQMTVSVSPGGSTTVLCSGTCTTTVNALPGVDTFTVSLLDNRGVVLSQGVTTQQIQRGAANTVNVTFNPVVAAAQITLGGIPGAAAAMLGGPQTFAVAVQASDPDGLVIMGPGNFINASGTPVTFTLSANDVGGNATTLSSGTIKGPADSLSLAYNGASAAYTQLTAKFSAPFATMGKVAYPASYQAIASSVRPGRRGAAGVRHTMPCCAPSIPSSSVGPATLTIAPFTTTAAANVNDGIVIGPDGNFWASGFGAVVKIVPGGSATSYPTSAESVPIIVGPDNNLWTGENTNTIARVTTAGVVTETNTSGGPIGSEANGSDGNVWFTEDCNGTIGKVTTAATPVLTEYPASATEPLELTRGPDGKLWYVDGQHPGLYNITTSGVVTFFNTGSFGQSMTAGPDGNMWVTSVTCCPTGAVSRISPATGAITTFAPSHPFFPTVIAAGPDGNLWFSEAFPAGIGRITPSGSITEWPVGIQTGPDGIAFAGGKVWFSFGVAIGFIDPANPSQGLVTLLQNVSAVESPGCFAEYGVPHMLAGADGKLWALDQVDGLLIHQGF